MRFAAPEYAFVVLGGSVSNAGGSVRRNRPDWRAVPSFCPSLLDPTLPEMGNSARNQHSSRPSFRIPRDHFVPGKRFCSKTNPHKLQGFERHMLSRGGAVAAPSDGGPRGGGPRGAAALMRRDAPRPSRTWHAPSAWRASCARRPLRSSRRGPSARAVRRARAVRCARHGGPRRPLPQHLLRVAVLSAAGRCRAERRCVAGPHTMLALSTQCLTSLWH